ncbi:hypothetical protein [Pseudoalteromonas luteoviolacea]|uniref:Uncharacterized protein n=1 Tax=Pseudoalteromonas luteoviolacea (strain 2ta16) TaxID=1353533 RepID=V4HTU3_PSEL2|nr:hypothetical protein [Pseudoalteromonas luteoviolacea]ESP94255.1 hypothetical protein PL2TA16_02100 [Pseudoalteromonas luteoviolacea 2ta16]KZN33699.1 hypothetical protein N483_26030 [Pseudoalteromonas luteoviolacea NCIMB 1944]
MNKSIIVLIMLTFCNAVEAKTSFIAAGEVSELLVFPNNSLVVRLEKSTGCKKESYFLKSGIDSRELVVDVILLALQNRMTISLHSTNGVECTNDQLYLDLVKIKSY